MIITGFVRHLLQRNPARGSVSASAIADATPAVLNVGGGNKQIPIPAHFAGWKHLLLDIDARGVPDLVCDARELETLGAGQFDAIYCSHNLEHYYKHDAAKLLQGFLYVLKADGFADVRVPDLNSVMRRVIAEGLDIQDVLYECPAGPITVCDVIYGWHKEIERSGEDFYAHKTGFTPASLKAALVEAGFASVYINTREDSFEVCALAFKQDPTEQQRSLLGL